MYSLNLNLEKLLTIMAVASASDWFEYQNKRYTVAIVSNYYKIGIKQIIFTCNDVDYVVNYHHGKPITAILRKIDK